MQKIQQMILEKLPEYSKNQKKIANFIIEHLETIPLLAITEVSAKCGVSAATVMRFARLLGFEGYMEFRNHLMEFLKEQLSPIEKYKATISKKSEYQDSLSKVAHQAVYNINHSLQQNKLDEFKHLVNQIKKADTIFCAGMGISRYMADIMAYSLKLYLKKSHALSSDSMSLPEQIILLSKKDLLITFSFPPYSRQTIESAQIAQKLKIPVISFTDKKTAPVVKQSQHVLIAKTDNILFTNSLGAVSVLINAIVTEIALSEEDRVLEGFQKIEKLVNGSRYFY